MKYKKRYSISNTNGFYLTSKYADFTNFTIKKYKKILSDTLQIMDKIQIDIIYLKE